MNTQEALTDGVRNYYNGKQEDRNLLLAGEEGIINHHFGIGDFDRSTPLAELSPDRINKLLHDLELRQIDHLIEVMGRIEPGSRILDAGCGRGGTAFTLARRFSCEIEAITISAYQKEFTEKLAKSLGLDAQVHLHLMDYLQLSFAAESFDHVITNETTLYAQCLTELFRGFHTALKKNGRYTIATWCLDTNEPRPYIEPINNHYHGKMHTKAEYLKGLEESGFENIQVLDFTTQAIPYWEARKFWAERSGIEDAFLTGHQEGRILYLYISADKKA